MEQVTIENPLKTGRKYTDPLFKKGLRFNRVLTNEEKHPYDKIKWERRTALITNDKGETIFELKDVEVPAFWSQIATNVVASRYFRSQSRNGERETSVRQIVDRVVSTITHWGQKDLYFTTQKDAGTFSDELTHILVNQMASFNSPVWFNVGIEGNPQVSACFINSVEDTMESIMELATTEAMLFKGGSGSGTNFSSLRSSKERLSSGGWASGPVSFMRGYDAFAGVIKSGGRTRRASKMAILNVDHPDILEFIDSKVEEEKKAWALIDVGYDGSINGEAYGSVAFQNANNSVRVTDKFMKAAIEDRIYRTKAVLDGSPMETLNAKEVLFRIAEATHICGDPGLQFHDTINRWHTCRATGEIQSSNPCVEFMFLNNSACNLASLNLMRFVDEDGCFDVELFKHVVDIMITAQDIIVDNASYPTEAISRNTRDFRPLGLGYANLGALLMSLGLPYDSDKGRGYASAITALMTGEAYAQSGRLAEVQGAFAKYKDNTESMLGVVDMHVNALYDLKESPPLLPILKAAKDAWCDAVQLHGLRNAQVTVLAPTGTIAFMMDCDTTGIEPAIGLVSYKRLVDGGAIRMVNHSVSDGLRSLGYCEKGAKAIVDHIDKHDTIEGAPGVRSDHLSVFDCALAAKSGGRSILPMGHIKMMAAVQPFISGAISKTVNVSNVRISAQGDHRYRFNVITDIGGM
ncbi:MAG: vitamin B12-dependent ribonucleotide reductase [Proteobacteria bacterium]|nr:vitamin B12-dependent ribonucleotide reductase [Pseudomonadota bacterium]